MTRLSSFVFPSMEMGGFPLSSLRGTFITGMNDDEYRAIAAYSFSQLKNFELAPSEAHYKFDLDNGISTTSAMELGRCFHLLVENEDLFYQRFSLAPEGLRRGTKKWEELSKDKTLIKEVDWQTIHGMAEAIKHHPSASILTATEDKEVAAFYELEGFPFKSKMDVLNHDLKVIVDYKSVLLADPKDFKGLRKFLRDGLYHYQAALYQEAVRQITGETYSFVFVCVEKKKPHAVVCCTLPDDLLEEGLDSVRSAAKRLDYCINSGKWDGYPNEIIEVLSWKKIHLA